MCLVTTGWRVIRLLPLSVLNNADNDISVDIFMRTFIVLFLGNTPKSDMDG